MTPRLLSNRATTRTAERSTSLHATPRRARKRSFSNARLMTPQRRTIFTARIILKRSAKKHRFTEADVLYEMRNALTVEEDFEASRVPKTW